MAVGAAEVATLALHEVPDQFWCVGSVKGKAAVREPGADGKFESPKLRASTRARVDEAAEYREMRDQVCCRRSGTVNCFASPEPQPQDQP